MPYVPEALGEKGTPLLRLEMKWTATMAARKPSTRPLHSPTCKQPQLRHGPGCPVTLLANAWPAAFMLELMGLQQELGMTREPCLASMLCVRGSRCDELCKVHPVAPACTVDAPFRMLLGVLSLN